MSKTNNQTTTSTARPFKNNNTVTKNSGHSNTEKNKTTHALVIKPTTSPKRVKPSPTRAQMLQSQRHKARNLPITGDAQALHMPKKGKVHDNLKRKSPWYQSIIDPLHGADCKIPDDCGDETGTLQLVHRSIISVPTGVSTSGGFRTNTLYSSVVGSTNQGFSHNGSSSTILGLSWASSQPWETSPVLEAYAQGHRVVSAAIYVQPECSLADCSGELCFFQTPMDRSSYTTYTDYANHYGSTIVALNSVKPMMTRWYPYSRPAMNYTDFYLPNASSVGNVANGNIPFWELGFITSGVPEGVSFRVTVAINYEFLPHYNAVNILDAAPSPTDATEAGLVEHWVAEAPVAHAVSTSKMTDPPSSVTPSQDEAAGPDGFGMFTQVLTELLPYAIEGIGLLL
jgi:hypothetical protein